MKRTASVYTLILCCVLSLLAGCLDGERTFLFQYDRVRDQFAFLTIYRHIRSNDQGDMDHLLTLYRNRDHLIVGPFMVDILGGHRQFLRLSATQAATVDFARAQGDILISQCPFDLEKIQITPGIFFRQGVDDLCYYHQTVIPGATADAIVQEFSTFLGGFLRQHAQNCLPIFDQTLERRKAGEVKISWEQFTADAIQAATHPPMTGPVLGNPLDTASIQSLRDAVAGGRIDLRRRGAELLLKVPLTPRDTAGVADCFARVRDAVRVEADRRLAAKMDSAAKYDIAAKGLTALRVASADAGHLDISIDLNRVFDVVNQAMAAPGELKDDQQAAARELAQWVADRVDVDTTLTVEQVRRDFLAGTLAGHPQYPPVKPGEGLMPISAATQP